MSEYIRVNINFLPENQTHMSVYNEIMEAKKNKIQPTEFLINTVLELRKYKAEKQQLEERQKRYAEYMEYRNAQTGGAIEQLLDPIPYNIPAPKVETGRSSRAESPRRAKGHSELCGRGGYARSRRDRGCKFSSG